MKKRKFPDNFVWGSATAAYQVEGAAFKDGRGESIWDRYCSVPGNVQNGDTGENACDHYYRYKEDVAMMKRMGLKAYRFSISWSRILPKGFGAVNEKGLAFYSNLVNELLKAGIEPYVTLYHWDLPQALQDIGGWANGSVPLHFLEFSKVVFNCLGDRVRYWVTFNEPYCIAFLGYAEGRQAPGIRDFSTAVRVSYNLYVAHGLVVKHFREIGVAGEIGIVLNLMGRLPLSESSADKAAARRADGYLNRWFIEPILKGRYPDDMVELFRQKGIVLPEFDPKDLSLMSQKLDFIGLNYYNDFFVTFDETAWPLNFRIQNPKHLPVTDRNWPITPSGFMDMLLRMKNEYGIENIYITENGASYNDIVSLDGTVDDGPRCDFIRRHVIAMHEALEAGVAIRGYFLWSLYDNFEWSFGYSSRFGIVYIDFETQQRIIKKSGHLYSDIIFKNTIE